ncbi:hypothetical protein MMC07_008740 [Pseudocyphellaria aurata]|nr:hypothetical protein [Pseudocyphellaria aurata]
MYARGILFGKMKYELGDHSFVRCPEHHLLADIDFKTKGYFGGTYNAIGGVIKNEQSGETLFEISGMWSGEMTLKNVMTGHKEVLFNATNTRHTPPMVRPLEEQEDRESQRLWHPTVLAINERNHDAATDEKTKVEDMQREEAAKRAEVGSEWHPRLFQKVRGGPGGSEEGEEDLDWILNAEINGATPEIVSQQILAVAPILPGQRTSHQSNRPPTQNQPTQQNYSTEGDLIDFGQSEGAAPAPAQQPPVRNPLGQQPRGGPQELPQPMGHPIVRQDTETSEVDEFVDAKS